MQNRRATLSRLWVLGSVLYGLVRVLLVWRFLSGFGVNVAAFAVVEASSSLAYGWFSSRAVLAVIDGHLRPAVRNALPTVLAYGTPDVFVFLSAGRLPGGLRNTLLGMVTVTAAVTLTGLVLQVRRGRTARKGNGDAGQAVGQ